jgi:hypothetical protein
MTMMVGSGVDDDDGGFWKEARALTRKKFPKRSTDFVTLRALAELQVVRSDFKFYIAMVAREQLEKRVDTIESLVLDELSALQQRVAALEKSQ